jgi:acetylornithine deacetylase
MPVLLEAVVDEEGGGNGTLINRIRGIKAEQALIAEPTSTAFCCPASVGAHFFKLELVDPSASAIEQQFETANLLESVSPFASLIGRYARLRQKEIDHPLYAAYELIDRPKVSCALCKIKGGNWPSTLPYRIEMEGSVECVPGETLEQMRHDFETYLKKQAEEMGLPAYTIRWFGLRFPPSSIDPDHPWVRRIVQAARPIVAKDPSFPDGPIVVGGGGSDLRLFNQYGIPAVLYGPGGDNAHGVDEYVEADQLADFCLILANLLSPP